MDILIKLLLDEQISTLNSKLKIQTARLKELEKYENLRLSTCKKKKNGRVYYYVRELGKEERKYTSGNSKLIDEIKEFHYLNISVKRIQKNIKLLEQVKSSFLPIDYGTVNNLLAATYHGAKIKKPQSVSEKSKKWLEKMHQFKIKYELLHPDQHPEQLRVQTERGLFVRSKSEAQIANFLDACDITYIYELPHYCNGHWVRSDFTILSPIDCTTIFILEHEGLLTNPDYQKTHIYKKVNYMKEGFKPNINLFYSYDYPDQSFSLEPIRRMVDYIKTTVPPKRFVERVNPNDIEILDEELEVARVKSLFK